MTLKTTIRQINHKSQGIFNAQDWLAEGDGLYASARTTRAAWLIKRKTFSKAAQGTKPSQHFTPPFSHLVGLPRASYLLLGYAVEMYLKAGLVKAYWGCSENLLKRDLKKYGHKLTKLACQIDLPGLMTYTAVLDRLQKMVEMDARYPITPDEGRGYISDVNQRTRRHWDTAEFFAACRFAKVVRKHSALIDQDSSNPTSRGVFKIDDDGYIAYRINGHLRARITYRFSSTQFKQNVATVEAMRALFTDNVRFGRPDIWDEANLVRDDWK